MNDCHLNVSPVTILILILIPITNGLGGKATLINISVSNWNNGIPGLGTPVLYMLPLLPLVDKRKDFVSGSQGSDLP